MPDANGKFRGMSVPSDAWERVFGVHREATEHKAARTRERARELREAYEEHLDVIGPDTHSPFLRDFRR